MSELSVPEVASVEVVERALEDHSALLDRVQAIHTLGPQGTNCEAAARKWFADHGRTGRVVLHPTLEAAAEHVNRDLGEAVLGCAVYPELHNFVFLNLHRFQLVDSFVMPTHNMILASRDGSWPATVSSHPAPVGLIPSGISVRLVSSNAQASLDCLAELSDGCITTAVAAAANGLKLVQDFGPVPMVFTLHF
jgi:hypothetical protein